MVSKRGYQSRVGCMFLVLVTAAWGAEDPVEEFRTTLDRLEAKGLVKTWMGGATPQRGGRRKRMVRLTAKGVREAASFYDAVLRASRGVSWEASCAGDGL